MVHKHKNNSREGPAVSTLFCIKHLYFFIFCGREALVSRIRRTRLLVWLCMNKSKVREIHMERGREGGAFVLNVSP